jgi:hypothetical protein
VVLQILYVQGAKTAGSTERAPARKTRANVIDRRSPSPGKQAELLIKRRTGSYKIKWDSTVSWSLSVRPRSPSREAVNLKLELRLNP